MGCRQLQIQCFFEVRNFEPRKNTQRRTPHIQSSTGSLNYTWNGENRLVSATNSTNHTKLEFAYDYMGRRFSKKVYTQNADSWILTSEFRFVYDGYQQVAEFNGSEALQKSYVWLGDSPGWVKDGATHYYYIVDGNKNVRALIDDAGSVVADYAYNPFGKITSQSGAMGDVNPFRFSSEYYDNETKLIYYNYRYYNSILGRWLNRDPIEEQGGDNLYGFVNNNPISKWDVLGLKKQCCDGKRYDDATHCCCQDREIISRQPIPTGIKICTAPGTKYSVQHKWIEWPGGSIGFTGSDNFAGIGAGSIQSPDNYANNSKKSCADVKLSPCDYDFSKLIGNISRSAVILKNQNHFYFPGIYDCTAFVQDFMGGMLYPASTAGLGCTCSKGGK